MLNKVKIFDDFPFIKDILNKLLRNKVFTLIPNSVITFPLEGTLYDIVTMKNVNDIIFSTFIDKVTPNLSFDVSYFILLIILVNYH